MGTSNAHQKMVFIGLLLISSHLNADSFSGGTGWGKLAQVLLAVSACQNRLLETERAACFKRNARQACQYAPEGVEKDNCIKEYSGYSKPADNASSKEPSPTVRSYSANQPPKLLQPFSETAAITDCP